ncbi:hypothetical protein GCM10011374_03230 [Kocuria dechangensis]|uniref:Uncharacterized protein n=1 Tax=Kocuria dechangensis TaxID=1176249 RepID=A0A917GFR8_9MICC|nr:hypothetical protein [Kocuria dechangensis]GGG44270.1 hypothetical protein GCM10011374_03230 [Kocuria dechangensis]
MTYSYRGHNRDRFNFKPTNAGSKNPAVLVEHPGGAFVVPLDALETFVDDLRQCGAGARRNWAMRNAPSILP